MFGLDGHVASLSDGTTLLLVLAVAALLGLRHATDPDHLTAVTALVASGRERAGRAARLGLCWGVGHGASLFVFGLPFLLYRASLPRSAQRGIEAAVGVVIVWLALSLLRRRSDHAHRRTRSPLQALGIGVLHGAGGSAGVGVLLLATVRDESVAVAGLALFAACTALSMTMLSGGLGRALASAPARRVVNRGAPALGVASLLFGTWYALGALALVPSTF